MIQFAWIYKRSFVVLVISIDTNEKIDFAARRWSLFAMWAAVQR